MLHMLQLATHDRGFFTQLIIALVALVGALGAAFGSFLASRKNVYVNSITIERSKWIEKLRNNLASYSAELIRVSIQTSLTKKPKQTRLFQRPSDNSDDDFLNRFHRLEELASVIRLQLNPHGRIDAVILFLLDNCGIPFVQRPKDINRFNKLLVQHSQRLLKAEWERVKWEAGGIGYRLAHLFDAHTSRRKYNSFLEKDGDVTTIFALAIADKVQREQGCDWTTEEQYEELVRGLKSKPAKQSWLKRKMLELSTKQAQARLKSAFENSSMAKDLSPAVKPKASNQ